MKPPGGDAMLKVNVIRALKSDNIQYDYIMVSGLPEDIARLLESLSKQFSVYVQSGRDSGRSEPRFEGSLVVDGEEKESISGYFSITISPEMRCASPGCEETFDLRTNPAAAFRQSGLVCAAHEHEAHWVRPKEGQ
jgi:hypothetical protein